MAIHFSILAGKIPSRRRRCLTGYSLQSCKELNITEALSMKCSIVYVYWVVFIHSSFNGHFGCFHTCACLVAQSCPTLCDPKDPKSARLLTWDSPGKNIGVGSHFLLQGIFLTRNRIRVFCITGEFFTV